MMRRWYIWVVAAVLVGGLWWLLGPKENPRELVLGEWKEVSSRLRVEVEPERAAWRGMGHGSVKYEWLQTEKSPYRLRFVYQGDTIEANLFFDGENTAVFEPEVWDKMPTVAQEHLRRLNRRHNRPDTEFRLIFRRETTE